MTALLDAIERWGECAPDRIALDPIEGVPITYCALARRVAEVLPTLRARHCDGRPVALVSDYGSEEAVLEVALLEAGIPVLSLPLFFTQDQRRNAIAASGVAWTYRNAAEPTRAIQATGPTRLPEATARITFTSGSTGAAKGVCLSAEHMLNVARAVVDRVGQEHAGRHCALLPPGILLETVAGFYATILAGGTYVCPRQELAGLGHPFRPDFATMARRLEDWRITSLILVPEYLAGLVTALSAGGPSLANLTLVAVGGARISSELQEQATALGLPVRQGYGLTECASVVSLHDAGDSPGSAGRPLAHMRASLADDGEILLEGPHCLGTLGSTTPAGPFHTGDIGRIDDAGRLWIEGRKSNLIVTSFGRNIAPEWVEEALLAQPGIAQAFVHGDGRPFPEAVLVPASPAADLAVAVEAANSRLPSYAQISAWREAAHFTPQNGLLTGNGRMRRREIAARYAKGTSSFFARLEDGTVRERLRFMSVPQVRAGLAGTIDLPTYLAYLGQAYHHVCHTVALMREARAGLAGRPALQAALDEYIAEETGHEEWILSDIAAAGGDAERVRHSDPHAATKAMVDHAYARIRAGDPMSFFGMVYVLESVSVALASRGASAVAERLGLPPQAFTYLTSHGALDQSHMAFFEDLVNGLDKPADQQSILTMAREMFGLFGGMFAAIEMEPMHALA